MNQSHIAWVAGLYEGEGTTFLVDSTQGVVANIANADRSVLDRVAEWTGLGRVNGPYKRTGSKPMYYWSVSSGKEVVEFFDLVWEWLSLRRRKQAAPVLVVAQRKLRKMTADEDDRPADCGVEPAASMAGAQRHRKKGERPCRQCALNERAYNNARKSKVKNYSRMPQEV